MGVGDVVTLMGPPSLPCMRAVQITRFGGWESQAAVEASRGSRPSEEQSAAMIGASVTEYDIAAVRFLT